MVLALRLGGPDLHHPLLLLHLLREPAHPPGETRRGRMPRQVWR